VADKPKVLAEVNGRPFLAYLLDQVAAAGVESAVLCTGHLGEQVRSAFGDHYGQLRLGYSREPAPLGTGGALRQALPMLGSDPVLVLNGDSFCDLDIDDFLHFHRSAHAAGSMTLTEMSDTRRYGRAVVQADGAVSGLLEKADASGPGWINAGVYLFSQPLLRSIPGGAPSLEREILPAWAGRGLYGYRCNGAFLDIGIPETYAASARFFESCKPTASKRSTL
jgi:NDP-sugar pyrophosphorylase family protein